jgi:hypothetical protein
LRRALTLTLLLALTGCPSAREDEQAQPEPEPAAPRGETGTVVGVVRLAEGATLPRARLGASGSATTPPPGCPAITERDHTPVFEVDGKLVNVLVSATGDRATFFPALPEREPAEVELIIGEDCRLAPRLLAAVEGDTLVLKNRAPMAMLPFVGEQDFLESLSSAESRRVKLEKRGVRRVACGLSGYCGGADLVVVPHPVFGVTGVTGELVIDEVPADQDVTLHAWHPLFKETSKTVRVGKGERVEVELVIEPATPRGATPE